MRKLFFILAIGLCTLSFASAQKFGPVLNVAITAAYVPFSYHDQKTGELAGFDVDITNEIAKRIGVKVNFIVAQWDGSIAGVDAGRYDFLPNVSVTEERKKKYDFSTPCFISKAVLVISSSDNSIHSLQDLKGKRSAQDANSHYSTVARNSGAQIVVAPDGFNQAVSLILSGRADVRIDDRFTFKNYIKAKPDAKLKAIEAVGEIQPTAFILSKGRPELLAAINKAIADMHADGTFLAISKKYFGEDVSQ